MFKNHKFFFEICRRCVICFKYSETTLRRTSEFRNVYDYRRENI